MFSNFLTAIPGGATMTMLIILAMHSLISIQPTVVDDRIHHELPVFIYEPPDEDLLVDDFKPPRIDELPPAPPLNPPQDFDPGKKTFKFPTDTPTPKEPGGEIFSAFAQDGPLVAIVRVQPTYPSSQSSRGIEGYVVVEFDVLPDGTVGNIAVLESSSKAFERSAIQAASRFRYKARIANGEPQLTTGIRYRFKFEMNQ